MKKTAFIYLCLIGGILNSCTKESKIFDLNIAVQSSFDGDKVQVLIDDEELINKQFQTNYSLGLSGGVVTTRDKGRHEIKVVVNNASGKAKNFTLDSDLYVGVNYDRQTNAVSFIFSKQPFAYD
jgi:hypothetical protein